MGFASGLCNGKPGVPAVYHKLFSKTQEERPIISHSKMQQPKTLTKIVIICWCKCLAGPRYQLTEVWLS